jgi:HAD superfamily hydrolase (TIGR01549 family)
VDLDSHAAPGGRVDHAASCRIGRAAFRIRRWIDRVGHAGESSIGPARLHPRALARLSRCPLDPAGADAVRFEPVRAVLFDLDGTLVDTLPFMYAATELVMAEYGVPITWDDYRRHFTPDWRLLYRRFGMPEQDVDAVGARWWTLYRGRDEAKLLPSAADAVQRLSQRGIVMGIVTAGRRDSVEPQLVRHGLAGHLAVRVYGDDPFEPKPGPAGLLHAMDALGVVDQAAETAYVGDALDDMRMAVAAGARGIGIRTELATESELRAAGATEVAASVFAWVASLPA